MFPNPDQWWKFGYARVNQFTLNHCFKLQIYQTKITLAEEEMVPKRNSTIRTETELLTAAVYIEECYIFHNLHLHLTSIGHRTKTKYKVWTWGGVFVSIIMTMKGVCSVSAEQDSDIRYDTPPELNRQILMQRPFPLFRPSGNYILESPCKPGQSKKHSGNLTESDRHIRSDALTSGEWR